jgi:hypothetical protein
MSWLTQRDRKAGIYRTNNIQHGEDESLLRFDAMMEAVQTSETSVYTNKTTRHYTPEDSYLHSRRRENLKSRTVIMVFAYTCTLLIPRIQWKNILDCSTEQSDRLCGLVVSVADYKHRGPGFDSRALLRIFWWSWVWNGVHSASWSDKLSSYLNKEVTVRFGKLKMQLWDSIISTQYHLVQSGKTASGGCSAGQGSSEL